MPEESSESDTLPRSVVLLQHKLPDGSAHVDWLIAPQGGEWTADDRVLLSWRLCLRDAERLMEGGDAEFEFGAVRLSNHRYSYLDYEGEVGGGRGRVMRVAKGGIATLEPPTDYRFRVLLAVGGVWRLLGERIGTAADPADFGPAPLGLWRFVAVPVGRS